MSASYSTYPLFKAKHVPKAFSISASLDTTYNDIHVGHKEFVQVVYA